jgi:hypothetical protein
MSQSADDSRAEALERLDIVERELAQLEESVRGTAARLRGEVARARAAVHDLHGSALTRAPAAAVEPPVGGDDPDPELEPEDDGARLVALDLVLREVSRADAERELAESFPGSDAARLLDEAGASLGR